MSVKHFAPKYFRVAENTSAELLPYGLESEAASLRQAREKEFLSTWGDSSLSPNHTVYIFYRNCLARGGDIFLRRARVFGMQGIDGNDSLDAIEEFFRSRIGKPISFGQREDLNTRFRQSTPGIAIQFPRVAAQSSEAAFKAVELPAASIALLMSADGGAAPEFMAAGMFNDVGENGWIFNVPAYPGNVIAPFGPDDYFMNTRFELLSTQPQMRFYFGLYRDAVAEQNLDVAYFRYWSVLESMARGKGFKKGAIGVARLLKEHEKSFNVNLGLTTNGQHFTTDEFIPVWEARRNITAHFGAFDPQNSRQRAEKRSFEIASTAIQEAIRQQNDFYLNHLKWVARLILSALLLGK